MLLYRSNDLEELAERLAEQLAAPPPASGRPLRLLEVESVLIQSAGMERWLSRRLASRLGVLACVDFPFPRAFLRRAIDAVLGQEPACGAYEREQLTWTLYELLGEVLGSRAPRDARPFGPEFEPLRASLAPGPALGTRRLLLAQRLAHLYDQYLTFRPELVLGWESSPPRQREEDGFQPELWRRLVARLGSSHLARRAHALLEGASDDVLRAALPPRVFLVGGPGLPCLYLQLLSRIGRALPVHVFSFAVSEAYLAELPGRAGDAAAFLESSPKLHPLLASSARVGADYQWLLEEVCTYEERAAVFRAPAPTTLLAALQRDLSEGARRTELLPAALLDDGTLTLDSCHSRQREVEVLHDRLLRWFAEDPALRPEDVVVLAPDIEAYAPLIHAVFSARAAHSPIPLRVADRRASAENPAAAALLAVFALLPGRLRVSEVLDVLGALPVRERFGLDALGLERIAEWASRAGVHWGADAAHRAEYGLPASDECTLRHGLRRLLLGYAHVDDGDAWLDGLVPVDDVAAGEAELLGRFADFVETLLELRARVPSAGLLPAEWRALVDELCTRLLVESSEGAWDLGAVRRAAHALLKGAEERGLDEPLELEALRHLLAEVLDAERSSTDFLAGGVTFCELLPLRTIPFSRVCVLGLEQGVFPRVDAPRTLDLIAARPARGDRSLRDDDRYLLLELLLAARERVALSCVGRSVADDTPRPLSVVVEELRETIAAMVEPGPAESRAALRERALRATEHPLQPFSARCFSAEEPRLRSFDPDSYAAALALVEASTAGPRRVTPFVRGLLPAPTGWPRDERGALLVGLSELKRFWSDPAAAFLRRLQVGSDWQGALPSDDEPLELDSLERYGLGDRLVRRVVAGEAVVTPVELRRGGWPIGVGGEEELTEVAAVARDLGGRVATLFGEGGTALRASATRLGVDASLQRGGETIRLTGSVEVYPAPGRPFIQLDLGFGGGSGKRQVALWVAHLAAAASGHAVASVMLRPRVSGVLSTRVEATLRWPPLSAEVASALLGELLGHFLAGQRAPLPFFPGPGLEVLAAQLPGSSPAQAELERLAEALDKALAKAGPSAAVALAFRGREPLAGFEPEARLEASALHAGVLGPLLRQREVDR